MNEKPLTLKEVRESAATAALEAALKINTEFEKIPVDNTFEHTETIEALQEMKMMFEATGFDLWKLLAAIRTNVAYEHIKKEQRTATKMLYYKRLYGVQNG